jgi:hypothetical protein
VQDVAIELQRVEHFNYLQLYKRRFILVEFVLYFGYFFLKDYSSSLLVVIAVECCFKPIIVLPSTLKGFTRKT